MPVALGATITDPSYVFVQIVFLQTAFFLTLGIAIILDMLAASLVGDVTAPTVATLLGGFPARSTQGLSFLVHSGVFGVVVAYCVERRKMCFDFVLTTYTIYATCCWIDSGFPMRLLWWATVLAAGAVSYGVSRHVCYKREMQQVEVGSPLVVASRS